MTCTQLCGPCALDQHGAPADAVIKAQDAYLQDAVAQGDTAHEDEMQGMRGSAGYLQVLGQVPDDPVPLGFAVGAGLQLAPAPAGVDLTALLEVPTVVRPTPHHRLAHLPRP